MVENIFFKERVSEIIALHNWDVRKGSFLGFAMLKTGNDRYEAVCLLVLPNEYMYHRMDGSETVMNGIPVYRKLETKDKDRVFTQGRLMATIRADKDILYWEINSVGGVPPCYYEKFEALKAAGKL